MKLFGLSIPLTCLKIPLKVNGYVTRFHENIPRILCCTEKFKNSFFLSTISECNELDASIRNYDSFDKFKGALLKFIRPCYNSVFSIRDSKGLELSTRLRFGFRHLNEYMINIISAIP